MGKLREEIKAVLSEYTKGNGTEHFFRKILYSPFLLLLYVMQHSGYTKRIKGTLLMVAKINHVDPHVNIQATNSIHLHPLEGEHFLLEEESDLLPLAGICFY